MNTEKNNFLKHSILGAELSDVEIIKVSGLMIERQMQDGDYLTRENADATSLFVIKSGRVEILKHNFGGNDMIIGKATSGSIIGEVAFFDNFKRSADTIACGPVSAYELQYTALEELIRDDLNLGMRLYHAISASLIEKLKGTTVDLTELISTSHLATLGEMATGIGHEINNPLSAIGLLVSEIGDIAKKNDPTENRTLKLVSLIEKSLVHISKTLNGIRMVGRDAKSDPMVESSVKEIIDDTIQLCQGKIKSLGINVSISVPATLILQCRTTQISQVLLNLLCNSCDAIGSMNEKWIQIAASDTADSILISVTDSGGGIAKETQNKIFCAFFSTKGPGKGTGIGLSISKKLIESHQGVLYLDSDSPNTRFVIQLPKKH